MPEEQAPARPCYLRGCTETVRVLQVETPLPPQIDGDTSFLIPSIVLCVCVCVCVCVCAHASFGGTFSTQQNTEAATVTSGDVRHLMFCHIRATQKTATFPDVSSGTVRVRVVSSSQAKQYGIVSPHRLGQVRTGASWIGAQPARTILI